MLILGGVKFFYAKATRDLLWWAAVCMIGWLSVFMMKVWYWMELNKNTATREI